LSIQEITVLAYKTSFVTATASPSLRWVFVWTASILSAIVVLLLVTSHPSVSKKPDSDNGSLSSLKADAYRQPKPLGSAFSTPQNRPEPVLVTVHDAPQSRQMP
jgi:hypothetical protein